MFLKHFNTIIKIELDAISEEIQKYIYLRENLNFSNYICIPVYLFIYLIGVLEPKFKISTHTYIYISFFLFFVFFWGGGGWQWPPLPYCGSIPEIRDDLNTMNCNVLKISLYYILLLLLLI